MSISTLNKVIEDMNLEYFLTFFYWSEEDEIAFLSNFPL